MYNTSPQLDIRMHSEPAHSAGYGPFDREKSPPDRLEARASP